MLNNNNIFSVSNPARMSDALWRVMSESGVLINDMLIFLPSRRAVRTVEKMIAEKSGGVALLPKLVALGEGVDDEDLEIDNDENNIISNTERVIVLAKLLAADANIGNFAAALPIAHDLVRMQDYLENEGVDTQSINWIGLVDDKYANHFQNKARILQILSDFMPMYANGRITSVAARNADVRNWIGVIKNYKLVIVCASTASVPATADLMCAVAEYENGRIILSGKISGREQDFLLNTNPYNSEYKFLSRIGVAPDVVRVIDVGNSVIDFMNFAFGNDCGVVNADCNLQNCHLIETSRESLEAAAVAEIAARSIEQNKSVLVITPDSAGNQRIEMEFKIRGITADFSGGKSGITTDAGRAILNLLDTWIETFDDTFDKVYADSGFVLFDTIAKIVDMYLDKFEPQFVVDDVISMQIWNAIKSVSDALKVADVKLSLSDVRLVIADAISGVCVRGTMNPDASVVVLGTIESRMQTADVVILTGLNEGMFPARGYENAWLPRRVADEIGLPSADRKVSLQSLDFMNLSCGPCVYWLRSTMSGGVQTMQSRFLSRVVARRGQFDVGAAKSILNAVAQRDDVPYKSLDYSAPTPPADWSDVYVTELELLIHNPYAFYVRHILRLYVLDDYWALPDARAFGNLVHSVIENATDLRPNVLVAEMDRLALQMLGRDSVIFHFWHKRFLEIAPVVACELSDGIKSYAEIGGMIKIAGRNVRARADRIWDGGVLDIKTGSAPNKKQLLAGNMPQLPLEAFMLQQGGFPIKTTSVSKTPIIKFLQLKNNDTRVIEYDAQTTQQMINASVDKVTELFNMYSVGGAAYEYYETSDQKYKQYDDLARVKD